MKAIAFTILIVIFSSSSCASQNFIAISKKIGQNCEGNKGGSRSTTFHDIRLKLFNEGKLPFLKNGFDTLYLLESYEIESGLYAGLIWNSHGTLNYTYHKGYLGFPDQKNYTLYTIGLIEKWDTTMIKAEEKSAIELPQKYITGICLVKQNGDISIRCVRFKEFFNLERDR